MTEKTRINTHTKRRKKSKIKTLVYMGVAAAGCLFFIISFICFVSAIPKYNTAKTENEEQRKAETRLKSQKENLSAEIGTLEKEIADINKAIESFNGEE